MKKLLLLLAVLGMALPAWGRGEVGSFQVCATRAEVDAGTCGPTMSNTSHVGKAVVILDGTSLHDCTGGGSTTVLCEWVGASLLAVNLPFANGDFILNSPDATFDFTRDTGQGTVTITASDADGNAALTVRAGGSGILTLGNTSNTGLILRTDGTAIQLDADIEIESASPIIDFLDSSTTTDRYIATRIAGTCSDAGAGTEDCNLTFQTSEAGARDTRLLIDGDGDAVFDPEPTDGGNGDVQHKINGIPKISPFVVAAGKTSAQTVNTDFGDSETPNTDWTQTANITTSDETTIFRKGSASLKMLIASTPADTNGADNALGSGDQDWSADESFGLWVRCDTVFSAGDWYLDITDNASEDVTTAFPAYGTADTWQWMELEIGSIADADKNIITDISISLSAAGATTFVAGGNCFFDYMWKWDAAEENALGLDIYEGGLLGVLSLITATGGDRTPVIEVESTDYFIHYETGNDFFVSITDLSNDSLWGWAALE